MVRRAALSLAGTAMAAALATAPLAVAAPLTARLAWSGQTGDLVGGPGPAAADGVPDGTFALELYSDPGLPVEKIELFTVDAAGAPCCGHRWSTQDPDAPLLGVSPAGGTIFNVGGPTAKFAALLGGPMWMKLNASGADVFRRGQAFAVVITLEDGTKVTALTVVR